MQRRQLTPVERKNLRKGLFFIAPWIIGILVFTLYPVIYSIIFSFSTYSGLKPPIWTGLQNYVRLFSDELVGKTLGNTFFYTALAVPVGIVVAILLALAMNSAVREVAIYRAALYIPSILPLFALSFIFIVLINPKYGLVNYALSFVGVPADTDYLSDPTSAKMVIVALAQLGAGNAALIFLAGLRGIPQTLYDAARIDGASRLSCFFKITLPLLSPIILFNMITGLSSGLQTFLQAFIITKGAPNNGTLFFMYYLYNTAFAHAELGYACALSLVLFLIGLALALVLFVVARRFVHYDLVS
ncbi:MAG: sugar ABC transporter permease [Ktedonobacteraceae bacterium]|nr:sugar ABC transporter permease [Ktedonobacteraceae bacterium]MBO0791432.1 sugar ABC transporter permease [Ktedonobacteraceae bacterium]